MIVRNISGITLKGNCGSGAYIITPDNEADIPELLAEKWLESGKVEALGKQAGKKAAKPAEEMKPKAAAPVRKPEEEIKPEVDDVDPDDILY